MKIHVLHGSNDGAAKEFCDFYAQTVGNLPVLLPADEYAWNAPAVLVGSEAVNSAVAELVISGQIAPLPLREGSDDYLLRSARSPAGHSLLILAGGRRRADYYAVYRYFREFASCRYFWDGDRVPHCDSLPLDGIDVVKRFHFQWRGLRYFAHRSLHRFQAEHWDWDDWKRELDWILKSQLNFFMLRTGIDDLFQKAYPDIVPYPPSDARAPGAILHSFNDRTTFWPLKYRGELRARILDYAKEHDLVHAEDMGPVTHWYSATPVEYLEHFQPEMLSQSSKSYSEKTMQVWDFRKERHLEEYWALTKAHIRHYGAPDMFHMIGLAERKFGTREESFRLKLYTYKCFIARLRKEYPHAPLLLASWDFMFRWEPEDVRELLKYLDPENTLILDYTTDSGFSRNNYAAWKLPNRFPWIFGIFQGLEPQNTLAFDYRRPEKVLAELSGDNQCKGMVIWSENSHANPRLLDFFVKNAASETVSLDAFCRDRYGIYAGPMLQLWKMTEKPFRLTAWSHDGDTNGINGAVMSFSLERMASIYDKYAYEDLKSAGWALLQEPAVPQEFYSAVAELFRRGIGDQMTRRDIFDLLRTALSIDVNREFLRMQLAFWAWRDGKGTASAVHPYVFIKYIHQLGCVLAQHDDFSMYHSFLLLSKNRPVNPYSEDVLKGNGEVSYCRAQISEFYPAIYEPEAVYYADFIAETLRNGDKTVLNDSEAFLAETQRIRNRFYAVPLCEIAALLPKRSDEGVLGALYTIMDMKNNLKD